MQTELEIAWQLAHMDDGATSADAIRVLEEIETELTCPICRAPSDYCRNPRDHKSDWF